MSHGGRGQVSARSVFLFTSEARAEGDISRGADDAKENSLARRRRASAPSHRAVSTHRPLLGNAARGVRPLSSVIARSRFAAFHARCVAASVRQRSRRFISLSLARAVLFSRCVRAFALMNAAFFARALPPVHPPARLVGEVVLRARALVVVLDGGVGFGVGRREARPRAGVRGPPRGRGSPPERRAPRSLGRRALKPRAVGSRGPAR